MTGISPQRRRPAAGAAESDELRQMEKPENLHRSYEDAAALLTGTLLVALGVTLYSKAVLLTGGTAGLALLLQYATGFEFGPLFFVLNLPFYYLSARRMGWKLTVRTFLAVVLVSVFSKLTPAWIGIDHLNPAYAAVIGGALMGIGLLILFRHRTSLGGINILALYLQERHAIRAGYVQLCIDVMILLAAVSVLDFDRVALSLAGAAVLNLILATNHRPGRYTGVS
jgi:uncharacterized membrane-anchored protein YitT (DUF2179 family)